MREVSEMGNLLDAKMQRRKELQLQEKQLQVWERPDADISDSMPGGVSTDAPTHRRTDAQLHWQAGALLILTGIAFAFFALWHTSQRVTAQSDYVCSTAYRVDETLPTGARWEMCWEHRGLEGIVLHDIYFTPPGGPRRLVLASAALAQVHVPYDDNGARFHDISDFGFGGVYLDSLSASDCPAGTLLKFGAKNAICKQIQPRGYAQKYYARDLQGYQLSLFSVNMSGDYNYITQWIFKDDGTIEPTMGAAGKLQRYGVDPAYGWRTAVNRIPISHYHNYWFRLDFDIDGLANDKVEQIQFNAADSNRRRVIAVEPILVETARSHDPNVQRSWRILDTVSKNEEGNPISYHIEALTSGHQFNGPAFESFTNNDIYITTAKACERFASHNPTLGGCATDMPGFVNGEDVNGKDIVVWYGFTFHHLPREEEETYMDIHWDSFTIVPRDWTGTNPLDTRTNGGSVMTPTPTRPSLTPQPSATPTEVPIACTNILQNPGFESADAWTIGASARPAAYAIAPVHEGARSLRSGIPDAAQNTLAHSSVWQKIALPETAGALQLTWWQLGGNTSTTGTAVADGVDYREAMVLGPNMEILRVLERTTEGAVNVWQKRTFDVSDFAGKTVTIYFNTYNNGFGSVAWNFYDDVRLAICEEEVPETPVLRVDPRYVTLLESALPAEVPISLLSTAPGPELTWRAVGNRDWLTVTVDSGTTPSTNILQVAPAGDSSASITGTVTYSATVPGGTVSTQTVEVTVLRGLNEQVWLPAVGGQ